MSQSDQVRTLTNAAMEHREAGEALLVAGDSGCVAYFLAALANTALACELRTQALFAEIHEAGPKPD